MSLHAERRCAPAVSEMTPGAIRMPCASAAVKSKGVGIEDAVDCAVWSCVLWRRWDNPRYDVLGLCYFALQD